MDSLLETAPCGFLSFNDDGRITLANTTLRELLAYPDDALVGERIETILPVAGRILYQTHFFPLLKLQGKVEEFFLTLRASTGEDVPVLVNAARRPDGVTVQNDCILMAMRRRSQYEDEILRAKRAAEEAIRARDRANADLRAALARERNIAVALQRSLTQIPAQDAFAGLLIHAIYEPAREEADVGGDFLDAFVVDGEYLAVMVGDVSGKGLSAAARTAEVKYTLRGMLYERGSPAAALADLNKYLCDAQHRFSDSGEEFVCASLALVEQRTGRMTLSVAGSEPPLVVRQNGATEEATVRGTPLGVFSGMEYQEQQMLLTPRDLLLLTTDGITEARHGGEFFGYEGLTGAATRLRETPELTDLAAGVVNEARAFAGGSLHDDACLMLVRRV